MKTFLLPGLVTVVGCLLSLGIHTWANTPDIPTERTEPLQVFSSPTTRVHLVELYTSQGCSSCPSADKWLAELGQRQELWQDFVPVSFHVDYWNSHQWQDPWSRKAFTRRQWAYSAAWDYNGVKTPTFAMNGKPWGTNWRKLFKREMPAKSDEVVGTLKAERTDKRAFVVSFVPSGTTNQEWLLHAALLARNTNSKVGGGENKGRTLSNDFVVVNLQIKLAKSGKTNFFNEFSLPTPEDFPTNVEFTEQFAVAFWVSPFGSIQPVQTTGGLLQ